MISRRRKNIYTRLPVKLFVPGRICLFGEHSDWAGGYRRINANIEKGYTLICGTEQGIYAEIDSHPSSLIITSSKSDGSISGPIEMPMQADQLLIEAQKGGFWSYIAGVAYQVITNYHVGGLTINNFKTDLPIKKGLSSSAAISVLTARAFNRIYDLKLTVRGEMELAYMGEITTPSRCGRMDQGCAFGDRPVLMTFDGDRLETRELHVKDPLYYVIVDLQSHKNTLEILNKLNHCYPFAENDMEKGVQNLLGPINKKIIFDSISALERADAKRVGELMSEAQFQFDKYAIPACPEELTAHKLHEVIQNDQLKPYILGAKGVGSQGDGSAQFLANDQKSQEKIIELLEKEFGLPALKLTIKPSIKVRKALIPAAGFGTRLFPASKATKKELFPIIDKDGIAKPAILVIVEEAIEAGIDEIIIIVQEEDLSDFQGFFKSQISIENYNKLSKFFQEYSRKILEIGRKVSFVIQPKQEGFGHAIYCAKEAINNEPFLLMLGDHIYRSFSERSCAGQLIDAYEQHGMNIIGLRVTPEDQIAHFGTVSGTWSDDKMTISITEFAEKPTVDYARENLRVKGLNPENYLTVFGQYILQPRIFDYLEEHIANNVREKGEYQLTSALERLRQESGFLGLIIDGKRFDIGIPQAYLDTLALFSRNDSDGNSGNI